ncbi:MAG: Lipid A export ATP-binding/permease protein MsbA [Chlamydiae bacterium]|nr:Lipid A export ATP-binding/permease protein MsbA [Chlamydiota bacterium]
MKLLFQLAFLKNRNFHLIVFTMIAMCFFTIGTQMEIVTIGILAKKGPGFFELFSPVKDNVLQNSEKITHEQFEERWQQLDTDHKGYIDLQDSNRFMNTVKPNGIVDRATHYLDQVLPISGKPKFLALLVICVALFNAIAMFCHRLTTKIVAIRVSRNLRQDFFEHIQSLPMSFYQEHNIGSISARVVTDASAIADGVNASLINYLQTPFTIFTTLILCFVASWQLTLMIFLGFPMIVFPILYIAKHVKRISKKLQKNQEGFSAVLIDYLAGIQTIKVFGREEFSLKKYREENDRMAFLEQKSAKYDVASRPIVHTIGMSFLAGALISGLYLLNMSVPEVIVYCGLLYVFYEPIKKFAETNSMIQRGAAAAERMYEVMQIKPQIQDSPNAHVLTGFEKSLEFRNVSFRYGDEWILKDLSFTVEKGQTVALVGPTGAGKSTIVQLIPRLYDVQKGDILIDGRSITECTQKSLRDQMAFVPQKPFLFLDTIANNITFGQAEPLEEIKDAAKRAHANEFIEELPEGYDTYLAETGKNLSGGQQQRLAIARALMKKAPILVMDEATSSLDAVSENIIKTAIRELRGQMTQIIIAHRLSTVGDADKIIYLNKGMKIAEGTRQELLKTCPPFKLMWDMMHKSQELSHAE